MVRQSQSTASSTRTFITPPQAPKTEPPKPPKIKPPKPEKKPGNRGGKLPWIIVIVLLLVSGFLFFQYRSAQSKLNPAVATAKQVNSLVERVAKIVILPTNETPTVATVVHADKLRDQSFFVNAKDGDKVLVYSKQKEAILYRPTTNQIVTISTVTVTPGSNSGNLSQ